MTDNPKWQIARLDDIEQRGRTIPVREHLGIHSFGVERVTPNDEGVLINDHDESGGQEELYVVLDGQRDVRDRRRDGRGAGRDVRVRRPGSAPEGDRRRRRPRPRRDTRRGIPGARLGRGVDVPQRVARGVRRAALRRRARSGPRGPRAVAGPRRAPLQLRLLRDTRRRHDDETFDHLRRSVELFPPFRAQARNDSDFTAVRDDPRFEDALR